MAWRKFVEEAYAEYADEEKRGSSARALSTVFNLKGDHVFQPNFPPCFLAGKIETAKYALCSLNPGYAGDSPQSDKEIEIFKQRKWEEAYRTFFDWFPTFGNSRYYEKFIKLLFGVEGVKPISEKKEHITKEGYPLLSNTLVNFDLFPYHSKKTSYNISKKRRPTVDPYIQNLKSMIDASSASIVFLNGATYGPLRAELGFQDIDKTIPFGLGKLQLGHLGQKKAVWLKWFITRSNVSDLRLREVGAELSQQETWQNS